MTCFPMCGRPHHPRRRYYTRTDFVVEALTLGGVANEAHRIARPGNRPVRSTGACKACAAGLAEQQSVTAQSTSTDTALAEVAMGALRMGTPKIPSTNDLRKGRAFCRDVGDVSTSPR